MSYSRCTAYNLQAELKARGIKSSGYKEDLIARLQAADKSPDRFYYSTFTVPQLRAKLAELRLSTIGLKKDLIARLIEAKKKGISLNQEIKHVKEEPNPNIDIKYSTSEYYTLGSKYYTISNLASCLCIDTLFSLWTSCKMQEGLILLF
jgi:hypothetical protein